MKQYPVHSVNMNKALGIEDLTVGKVLYPDFPGPVMTIVESEKINSGHLSYAIVECGKFENGETKYAAFANNQYHIDMLNHRVLETHNARNMRIEEERAAEMIKSALAEKCLDDEKHPKVIQSFDENSIRIRHNGFENYVNPNVLESIFQYDQTMMDLYGLTANDVSQGLNIAMQATILDVEHGEVKVGDWNFPRVSDFGYENSEIAMETQRSIYSTIDFSKEFEEKQFELVNNRDDQAFFDPRFN